MKIFPIYNHRLITGAENTQLWEWNTNKAYCFFFCSRGLMGDGSFYSVFFMVHEWEVWKCDFNHLHQIDFFLTPWPKLGPLLAICNIFSSFAWASLIPVFHSTTHLAMTVGYGSFAPFSVLRCICVCYNDTIIFQ